MFAHQLNKHIPYFTDVQSHGVHMKNDIHDISTYRCGNVPMVNVRAGTYHLNELPVRKRPNGERESRHVSFE